MLFVAQRHRGIDSCGSSSRNITRRQRYGSQQNGHSHHGKGLDQADLEEKAGKHAGKGHAGHKAYNNADESEAKRIADDEMKDLSGS